MDSVLTAVLLAELLEPSREIWLVSAWISDVSAVDNSRGDYDSLFGDAVGARLPVVGDPRLDHSARCPTDCRDANVPENGSFLARLDRCRRGASAVIRSPDAHEKTFCGSDWLLSGSMNFTINGMTVNDEAVTYRLDGAAAAQARIDFAHRWRTA